jgi:hypothetical protein
LSVTPYSRRSLDRGTAATMIAAVRHADDGYSVKAGAGHVELDGALVAEVGSGCSPAPRSPVVSGPGTTSPSGSGGCGTGGWSARQGGEYPLDTRRGVTSSRPTWGCSTRRASERGVT